MVESKRVFQVPVWVNVEAINKEDARAWVMTAMDISLDTLKRNNLNRTHDVLNEYAVGDRAEIYEVSE